MSDQDNSNPTKPYYGVNQTTQHQEGWNVKEPKMYAETDPQQRVDLRIPDFDKLLRQKGANICVYRSMYCPNVKSADGAEHQIDCTLCGGSNYVDVDPIKTRVFIQSQDLQKVMTEGGDVDGNTVLMTFPIGVELQYFTRVELVDFTENYFQRVYRAPGTSVDILKFKACRVNVVMDQDGVQYYQQQDFNLDPNGNILWGSGRKPADSKVYSVHYEMHIQFRAVKAMHVSRFTQYKNDIAIEQVKLPEQWMMTKEFLLRRNDINTNQQLQEGPFENHANTTHEND